MPDESAAERLARVKADAQASSEEADHWIDQLDQHQATRPDHPDEEWLRTEKDLEASRDEALRQYNQSNDYLNRLAQEDYAAKKAEQERQGVDAQGPNEHLPPLTGTADGDFTGERTDSVPLPGPDFKNFPNPDIEEPTEVMDQAEPDPLTVGDLSGGSGGGSNRLVLAGATALGLVVLLGVGIGLGLGGNNGQVPPTHDPYLTMPGPTPTPSDTPYPTIPGPTPTPSDTPYPTMPGPTPTPSATPAVQYFIGPLQVKRDAGSTTTLYTLTAMGMPTDATVTWSISAPCGSLAPAQFSAYASWQKSATKECPPGHGGPFPGEVTVTITTPRGSISFSAGSETATVGEQTAIP